VRKIQTFKEFKGINAINESNSDIVVVDVQEEYQNADNFEKYIKYLIGKWENNKKIWWILDSKEEHDFYEWVYTIIREHDLLDFDRDYHASLYGDEYSDKEIKEFVEEEYIQEIDSFLTSISIINKSYGGYRNFMEEFGNEFVLDLLREFKKRNLLDEDYNEIIQKDWDIWVKDFFLEEYGTISKKELAKLDISIPYGFENFEDLIPYKFELIGGGENECLAECMIQFDLLSRKYKLNHTYVYQ